MKVIFLQDVPNVARTGEVKEVSNGYGRNFLMPKKLATLATPAATKALEAQLKIKAREQGQEEAEVVNNVEAKLKAIVRSRAQTEAELVETANQLDGKEVVLEARSGGKERLYGSITTADIATELQNIAGSAVDKRKIELEKPIHQLGSYEAIVRLAKDITPKIKVTVVENEEEAKKETGKDKEVDTKKKTRAKRKTKAEKETNQGESSKTATA